MPSNVINFPVPKPSGALKPGSDAIAKAISTWLEAGRDTAAAVEASTLQEDLKLQILLSSKDITVRILRLMETLYDSNPSSDAARRQIADLIEKLEKT